VLSSVKITVVFDNREYNPELTTAWGFACFIETDEKTILFDTGSDPDILLNNMENLGKSPKDIDVIFLSHEHYDHTGGLIEVLKNNCDVDVIVPVSFSARLKRRIEKKCNELIEVDIPQVLSRDVYSLGVQKNLIDEQALALSGEKGLIIITGCAHPGILEIVISGKEFLNQDIYLAMGGFHLKGLDREVSEKIASIMKKVGVKRIAPSHCTGDTAIEVFSEVFGDSFIPSGVGCEISI
jgi:7,8-dihydropterin-6-yl-methyl-4-(beta-D-ribofuranosyl)aminobenzene 5'-phosphate synthase